MTLARFDFEKPIVDLEQEIRRLREEEVKGEGEGKSEGDGAAKAQKIKELEDRLDTTRREIYGNLTPWQRVQLARHLGRPHALDLIRRMMTDWTELSGDRCFGDDHACLAGFARLGDRPVAVIGQQKGSDVRENAFRNYGSMHPEGYRKAMRIMRMAEKFGRPVVVLIDTQGAFPGIGAEERGQAEAIARNIMDMSVLRTPIVCAVIGEGGSGGALGIGVGDRLLMMENAYYSLISPEGCASILWRDAKFAPQAAKALKLTSADLKGLGIVDEVVPEPLGGAHRDPAAAARTLRDALERNVEELVTVDTDELLERRYEKYRTIGVFEEQPT
jgi:acetyl-CoA carboxylase carboxyl transferase subunit alpha